MSSASVWSTFHKSNGLQPPFSSALCQASVPQRNFKKTRNSPECRDRIGRIWLSQNASPFSWLQAEAVVYGNCDVLLGTEMLSSPTLLGTLKIEAQGELSKSRSAEYSARAAGCVSNR